MAGKDKQIAIIVAILVIGFLMLGSIAPQTMSKLNDFGADLNMPFFKGNTGSGAAFGYVNLVIEPPIVQNEQGTE